jgi:hypothetical protein
MMAQKRYILMFLVIINSITLLNCMEERCNSLIAVVPILERLLEKKELELYFFHPKQEVFADLFYKLRLNPRIFYDNGIWKSSLSEYEIVDLIKNIKDGLFTVKKNSPESSSPIQNNASGSPKNTVDTQNRSKLIGLMGQLSDAFLQDQDMEKKDEQERKPLIVGDSFVEPSVHISIAKISGKKPKKEYPDSDDEWGLPESTDDSKDGSRLRGVMSQSSDAILQYTKKKIDVFLQDQDTEKEDEKKRKVFKDLVVEPSECISIAKISGKKPKKEYSDSDDERGLPESTDDSKDGSSGNGFFDMEL